MNKTLIVIDLIGNPLCTLQKRVLQMPAFLLVLQIEMKPAISTLSLFCALTICICNTTSAVHKTLASKTLLWLQSCLLVQFV